MVTRCCHPSTGRAGAGGSLMPAGQSSKIQDCQKSDLKKEKNKKEEKEKKKREEKNLPDALCKLVKEKCKNIINICQIS